MGCGGQTLKPAAAALNASRPALAVQGLGFSYNDRFSLNDLTFTVAPGAVTALLGPNGAGKTTLFALITHLFETTKGHVQICGHDVRTAPELALAHIGVVFQQPTLDLDLSVRQNLRYFASLHGLPSREANTRMDAELERLGLAEQKGNRVRTLSGGFRRRTEIARAMLHRPSLLLLDEPTVGLDVPTRQRIVEHVHRLASNDGIAVLWATHLIDEVWPEDRLVVMHGGQIQATGSVAEVIRNSGAGNLTDAFARLTQERPRPVTLP